VAASATPTLNATTSAGSSMSFSAVLMKFSFPRSDACSEARKGLQKGAPESGQESFRLG
jgi:hypothetical protein